ncbi:hypothetical protein BV908_08540 [Diaphorobacter sp. LR2014-1]|nr:hypothetical protein BV908_08540 [Diaphorobacter sp. LR2014-1]
MALGSVGRALDPQEIVKPNAIFPIVVGLSFLDCYLEGFNEISAGLLGCDANVVHIAIVANGVRMLEHAPDFGNVLLWQQ